MPKTIEEHFILIPLNLIPEHKSVSGKQEKIMKTAYTRLILWLMKYYWNFNTNAELHDLKDLIYQLDNLRHLKQQELGKLPKDEMFEKAEEYLNDKGIENSLVFEEYNMDFKMKFNGSTYYCELLVDNSLEEKTEYRKNISVEKLTTWFEKLNSNLAFCFIIPE